MDIINKDITTVEEGIIGHQVNLQGVMGAGLAEQIKEKWPSVCRRYKHWCSDAHLGEVMVVPVTDTLTVANLAGQDRYGSNGIDTDYKSLAEALGNLKGYADAKSKQIYLPYKIGCGLAGGDWKIVKDIIEDACDGAILCKI